MVIRERIEELLHLIRGPMLADDLPLFGSEGLRVGRHFCVSLGNSILSGTSTRLRFRGQNFLAGGQATDHLDPICAGACAQAHITTDRSLLRSYDDEVELPHLCYHS